MPRRPDLPCADRGTLLWRGTTSLPAGQARCRPCRRAAPTYRMPNMRASGIVEQWTCDGCGTQCERPATKGQPPKWCPTCRTMRANRRVRVAPSVRRAIYARDDWTCWLCQETVDASLIGTWSHWRPSLDHVLPEIHGGTDDKDNLKLAHWWCNSARSDGRTYQPEDFRVAV